VTLQERSLKHKGNKMSGLSNPNNIKSRSYAGLYFIGKVVDNNDPKKLKRVRVTIPKIFDGYAQSDLPWAIPNANGGQGAQVGINDMCVPSIGSLIYIIFQQGKTQYPMYSGTLTAESGLVPELEVNYPTRRGFKTASGLLVFDDATTKELQILHSSGSKYDFDASGNLTVTIHNNLVENVSGTCNITVTGSATIKGANVTVDGGGGSINGVVNGTCLCSFTGAPHPQFSSTVKTSL